ncbi:MAG: glutaredoxin [Gemmatimonadetes bacterium]|nr:glutaredoxin [Gemmatimonadota bacterium]
MDGLGSYTWQGRTHNPDKKRRTLAESGVLIYTHPECTICVSVKMELDEKGKVYEEIDLGDHPERWPELQELTGGDKITPVVVEDGEVTIGYHGIGCTFY